MVVFDLWHKTKYKYEHGASFCHNLATLKPKDFQGQKLLDYSLEISPMPTELSERVDFFGNTVASFSIQEHHEELVVTSRSKIARDFSAQVSQEDTVARDKVTVEDAIKLLKGIDNDTINARQFILFSPLISKTTSEIKKYAEVSFRPKRSLYVAAHELMQRIFIDFDFVSGFTNIATPLDEVMKAKKGVCQDFAQVAIACVRSMGLPARYVSGYIETLPPEGKEKLIGTDASHAWFSVFIPSYGWVDFDPTNNQVPKDQHIVVAHGRDYFDVPPLKGVIYSTGKNDMEISVDLRPAKELGLQQQTQKQ
ncbi:transglutaminase family protein [Tamlana sp. 2_MG-2023]|uniref:transglutaminase family protein n=1 Tax=unclassified Tamlana TaxID=2614803 RepID=UPI0026E2473E|nr:MULTISPECIES: transglutaminase family protein [unclassified Tamlana]MDO6759474.1 transglutaminase family protein [Tamlana sp. 2_MG-2023]MDO6790387.1 transglutaminase family protein [Tamlana sp. 1_MG-2023]